MAPSPDTSLAEREPPLCVDLDGTLVRSDLLSLRISQRHHRLEAGGLRVRHCKCRSG
jgi:hypothetical protein